MYWLLMELLCGEFKKNTTEFVLSVEQIKAGIRVNYANKVHGFLTKLAAMSHEFDMNLVTIYQIDKNFYKIETPIILELMGKDFKRTRVSRDSGPAKKENKNKNKKENKNIESSTASTAHFHIIDYLNNATGKNFKAKSKTNQGVINTRLSEGFSLEDFEKVIDIKTSKWKSDPKMDDFLRPATLFGNKFESYLNETESKSTLDLQEEAFLNG